jgi:hypothetical protein
MIVRHTLNGRRRIFPSSRHSLSFCNFNLNLMVGSDQEARFFGRRGFSSNIQASAETFPTYKTFFLPIYLSGQKKQEL